jgi:hypothetical protein
MMMMMMMMMEAWYTSPREACWWAVPIHESGETMMKMGACYTSRLEACCMSLREACLWVVPIHESGETMMTEACWWVVPIHESGETTMTEACYTSRLEACWSIRQWEVGWEVPSVRKVAGRNGRSASPGIGDGGGGEGKRKEEWGGTEMAGSAEATRDAVGGGADAGARDGGDTGARDDGGGADTGELEASSQEPVAMMFLVEAVEYRTTAAAFPDSVHGRGDDAHGRARNEAAQEARMMMKLVVVSIPSLASSPLPLLGRQTASKTRSLWSSHRGISTKKFDTLWAKASERASDSTSYDMASDIHTHTHTHTLPLPPRLTSGSRASHLSSRAKDPIREES